MADLSIRNEGSICLLRGVTDAGKAWIAENIPNDAQTWCGSIVVEPRYLADITAGAINDGLEVE